MLNILNDKKLFGQILDAYVQNVKETVVNPDFDPDMDSTNIRTIWRFLNIFMWSKSKIVQMKFNNSEILYLKIFEIFEILDFQPYENQYI